MKLGTRDEFLSPAAPTPSVLGDRGFRREFHEREARLRACGPMFQPSIVISSRRRIFRKGWR